MIQLENVSRRWPDFSIRNVTLRVCEGDYLVIVGPTGAGKTLLLELLLGIHQPDEGRILIDGQDMTILPPEKRGIGMVYQDYVLFPHLNVERNLTFGLAYSRPRPSRSEASRKAAEIAHLLGITHLLHRYPATLSGGEKQRVAIGRAIMTEPRVLLLDEPFSALDRRTARRLRSELRSLHKSEGLTILHVTHDLTEARQIGGPIALIHEGELNALGAAEELIRRPPNLFAANFFGAINIYEARVEDRSGEIYAVAGPIAAPLGSGASGTPWLMVHPDEIVLFEPTAAGIGAVHCEVAGLSDEGNYVAVQLRVSGLPDPLIAYTGRQWLRTRGIELGDAVIADLSRAIHVLDEANK